MFKKCTTALWCTVAPFALNAQDVDLRSSDGFISVEGQIIDFNGVMLRVQTNVGAMSVPASEVICFGAGCLETIANNTFGLTADAFEDVVANVANPTVSTTSEDLQIAFGAQVFEALYTSLAGTFAAENDSGTSAQLSSGGAVALQNDARGEQASLAITSNAASADIVVQTVSLSGTQPQVYDGPSGWSDVSTVSHQLLGLKSFSVIVAPNAGINQISMDDLARIYAGELTNWSQIGGANVSILPLQMPPNSAIGAEILSLVMAPSGKEVSGSVLTMNDEAGISATINQFPGSVSIVTTATANPEQTVPVSGACGIPVRALPFNVISGDYPLIRPVMATYATPPTTGLIPEMFDFAARDAAQEPLEAYGFVDHSAIIQDPSIKNSRLSGLLAASLDSVQRDAAAQMFQVLFAADRMSPTLTGGAASGPEGGWNRGMMLDLIDALRDPANAGREVIFVGTGVSAAGSQAAVDLSAAAAQSMQDTFVAMASGVLAAGGNTVSSYGFGDVAPSSCIDGQVAGSDYSRVEIWIR